MLNEYSMTNRWIHARCIGTDEDTYIKLQKSDDKWYCSNCIALCGLCSGSILYIIMTEPSNTTNVKHGYIPHAQQYLMTIIKSYKPPTVHGFALLATQQTYQTSFSSSSSGIETSKPYQILMENRIPENDKLQHTCRNINKMFSININGIRGKKLELQAYLSTENPDIVALQETKIDSNIKSNELIPECLEYDIYRNDRTANGGGAMLLVKTYLKRIRIEHGEN